MAATLLDELPSPPPGLTGWPWTTAGPAPGSVPPPGGWPRISIVTPSYNQGQYIEETIRSIVLQGYPNLEYWVGDGGSRDESVEVIKKYSRWLAGWVSEPDRGQSHAINKGLARSTGEWFNWINSDDLLTPGALWVVGQTPNEIDAVAGACEHFSDRGDEKVFANSGLEAARLVYGNFGPTFHQPSLWLKRSTVEQLGGADELLNYAFDWDLAIRCLAQGSRVRYVPDVLSRFRLHAASKTCSQANRFAADQLKTCAKLLADPKYAALHAACHRARRAIGWYAELERQITDGTASRWRRACRVLSSAIADLPIRFSRPTLGALQRILFSRQLPSA